MAICFTFGQLLHWNVLFHCVLLLQTVCKVCTFANRQESEVKKKKSLFPSEDVSIRNIFQCIDYNFVIEINNSMRSVFIEKKITSMLRPIVLWAQPFTSSMKDLCIYV